MYVYLESRPGVNSHNINDMLFIEENIYMILKVFHY